MLKNILSFLPYMLIKLKNTTKKDNVASKYPVPSEDYVIKKH
jgi:hypothetical protein